MFIKIQLRKNFLLAAQESCRLFVTRAKYDHETKPYIVDVVLDHCV
jgi:hypothetical protein